MGANQSFIEKADMAVSDMTSGGLLVAEQAKEFFEIAIVSSVLLGMITTKPMTSPTFELSKMGFSGRVLRGAVESQALPKGDRQKPSFDKTTLTSHEFIGEVRIPYAAVEDNVANGKFVPFVTQFMGKAIARDMEDIAVNGDTSSTDTTLAILNGLIKQITTQSVSAGGARLSKSVLKLMQQTLPSQYFRDIDRMRYMTSKNAVLDYIDTIASRATPGGDTALQQKTAGEYAGVDVMMVPLFPENLGSGTDQTVCILADPKNATLGLQRNISLETAKDISAREYITVVTLRMDVKWAHEPATVKATAVTASAGA